MGRLPRGNMGRLPKGNLEHPLVVGILATRPHQEVTTLLVRLVVTVLLEVMALRLQFHLVQVVLACLLSNNMANRHQGSTGHQHLTVNHRHRGNIKAM